MLSFYQTIVVLSFSATVFSAPTRIPRAESKEYNLDWALTAVNAAIAKHNHNLDIIQNNKDDHVFMEQFNQILNNAIEIELAQADVTSGEDIIVFDNVLGGIDNGYLAGMAFGTPYQVAAMTLDTGSSDLWVLYSNLDDEYQSGYDPSKSTTAHISETSFNDSYGSLNVSGTIIQDLAVIGNYSISGKTFGVVTADSGLPGTYQSGIFPLASSVMSQMKIPTFFEDLLTSKAISNPYFSLYLGRGSKEVSVEDTPQIVEAGSRLCLGCLVELPSNVSTTGEIIWNNVTEFEFWEIVTDGITINQKVVASTSTLVIIDSGTTALLLPPTIAPAVAAALGGQFGDDGFLRVSGSVLQSQTIGFQFNGVSFAMDPVDLVQEYDASTDVYITLIQEVAVEDVQGNPMAILGDVFLKNVVSVFSYAQNGVPAVGFLPLTSSTTT